MARSSDERPAAGGVRGFVPPQTDAERVLMRHAEDLAAAAMRRGVARYSAFLSDREQMLCTAAMHRAGCDCFRFDGGFDGAERKVLCIEPEGAAAEFPVSCVRIQCTAARGAAQPQHKDYLGSLLGLSVKREGIGDILLPRTEEGTAYVFALHSIAYIITDELRSVGRMAAAAEVIAPGNVPEFALPERQLCRATVSSLRLDAVLAAMLKCSRGTAAELVSAGRVEINHLPVSSPGASVYPQDIFTIRGKGRYQLAGLPGKSRKDRQIIEYFQF